MSTLSDLRAIARGYDSVLVEAVGGQFLLSEGAKIESIKLQLGEEAKEASECMKEARTLANAGDRAKAEKKYDEAISKYKKLKDRADKEIEDDNVIVSLLDGMIQSAVAGAAIGLTAIFGVPVTAVQLASMMTGAYIGLSTSDNIFDGKQDSLKKGNTKWYQTGESRVATKKKFDNLIKICQDAKKRLKTR